MKNLKSHLLLATLIIATIICTSSCSNDNPKDTKVIAEENNNVNNQNSIDKDEQFLVNAAEISIEEINLGKLVKERGNMKHVKELGKMMVDEHTKSLTELIALAQTKNISIPTSQTQKGQDMYKKLSDKSINNFDKAYADMMVDGHKEAIALFEKASTDCTDPDIRAWAIYTLPALRTHLEHAVMCQKQCDKM